MAARTTDAYFEALERKPRAKANHEAAKETYRLAKKRQTALANLTGGGFLIPRPEALREGLEELREEGHRRADIVDKINRRTGKPKLGRQR